MNDEPKKREGRVFNVKTGEMRSVNDALGAGHDRAKRDSNDCVPPTISFVSGNSELESFPAKNDSLARQPDATKPVEAMASVASTGLLSEVEVVSSGDLQGRGGREGRPVTKVPKSEVETLEQFIEYAYGRKGQRISMKPRAERRISKNSRLDDLATARLLQLASMDKVLAVPRQLLLFTREINGFPEIRSSITDFVFKVITGHPAFSDTGIQAAIRNLPDGPAPSAALEKIKNLAIPTDSSSMHFKESDLNQLKRNACYLFATWTAIHRGFGSEELVALLFEGLWLPASRILPDDTARFQVLTEIEHVAGAGLACYRFRQQAIEARNEKEISQRLQVDLQNQLSLLETSRDQLVESRDQLLVELRALREQKEVEAADLRRQHAIELTRALHHLEQLQGRVANRLSESIDMLEVGLTAMRSDPPRFRVMTERAEHVLDELRKEMNNLQGVDHGGRGI